MTIELDVVVGRPVSRETIERLKRYAALLKGGASEQNLVAKSTIDELWTRHILDSAQLCRLAPAGSTWLDIGSGAGLPGVVIAILTGDPITLVEPRRLRADFLVRCLQELRLENAGVLASKVERVSGAFDVITARAVASLDHLLRLSVPLSHQGTRWILPKGRSGAIELAEAQRNWQGRFRTEPSLTDEQAVIVLAEGVAPVRGPRGGVGR